MSAYAVAVHPASAQRDSTALLPLIANPRARNVTALDGQWHAIIDPYELGYYDYRSKPSRNGWQRNYHPQRPTDVVEYDFDRSATLVVPADWNTQRPELMLYDGSIWYKQSFTRALAPGRRLFVYVGAANYQARVFLNGTELGVHEGGFTPFNFEITSLLRSGDAPNDLIVKVDARPRRAGVPTQNADWWNYGGLTRSVLLIETPATFVRDYVVQLDAKDPTRIKGFVQLDGPSPATPVTVQIPAAHSTVTVTPDASGRAELAMPATALARWSPESPKLYDVRIISANDTIRDRIGFRTLTTRGHQVLLNGTPVFLRGISMHEEAPLTGRRVRNVDEARVLLGWAKELGANYVRLSHYPYMEETVRLADEMGLLVWEEVPVYWALDWENPATLANASAQVSEMVVRDRNRAAVAIWSVSNETPRDNAPNGPRLTFVRALVDRVRALDDTRFVAAAMEHRYVDSTTIAVDDPLGAYLDVIGDNEYIGWYDQPLSKAARLRWTTPYDKPVIISEFGGEAKAGLHGSPDSVWTEEYQARLYEMQVAMLKRIDFLAGTSPWILKDFRSTRRALPGVQDYFNRKGLVSDKGERKKAFFVLQRWYRSLMANKASLDPTIRQSGQPVDTLGKDTHLYRAPNARVGEPETRVIRDAKDWASTWASLHAGLPAPPLPHVDFTKEIVLFVALGPRSTGGFDVDVERIIRRSPDDLLVQIVETSPGDGCMSTQVITSPAVAVRAPRAAQVHFVRRQIRTPC
ncbi:MAG TPA: glycoside hydrolase family 2 TIM barrel-domain containing protein [Gemmatimonadaceae bacterium]